MPTCKCSIAQLPLCYGNKDELLNKHNLFLNGQTAASPLPLTPPQVRSFVDENQAQQ
jgi:hypothetical protein